MADNKIKIRTAAAPVIITGSVVKSSAKSVTRQINPLDRRINKNDISDSGVEAMRLGYTSAKATVNTTKATLNTVKKSVKTVKNVPKAAKSMAKGVKTTFKAAKVTVKTAYKVTAFTVKTTVKIAKAAGSAAVHIAAALTNPIVLIALAVILIIYMIVSSFILLFGGAASFANAKSYAMSNPIGLIDIPEQWKYGLDFLNKSKNAKKADFNKMINDLKFDNNDLQNSDLVYMERTLTDGNVTIYSKNFATDEKKDTLKSSLDWSKSLNELEILSIAYVYLEKEENEKNGTTGKIYEVKFTQDLLDTIVNKLVMYSDNKYEKQECPNKNCTKQVSENPEYASTLSNVNKSAAAYNDWINVAAALLAYNSAPDTTLDEKTEKSLKYKDYENKLNLWIVNYNRYPSTYGDNGYDFLHILGKEYENFINKLKNTPQTITTYICDHKHDLHSLGLAFFKKDDIMNSLNFTSEEKEWEAMIEQGFPLHTTE